MYVAKEKIVTSNVIKKFCMQAWNRPETFWQTWARTRPEPGPDPTRKARHNLQLWFDLQQESRIVFIANKLVVLL